MPCSGNFLPFLDLLLEKSYSRFSETGCCLTAENMNYISQKNHPNTAPRKLLESSRWENFRASGKREKSVKEMKNAEAIKWNLLSLENPFFVCAEWKQDGKIDEKDGKLREINKCLRQYFIWFSFKVDRVINPILKRWWHLGHPKYDARQKQARPSKLCRLLPFRHLPRHLSRLRNYAN